MGLKNTPPNLEMGGTFMGRNPDCTKTKWSESQIQMYVVQEARREGYTVTAAMEQGKRTKASGGRAKAMGMTAGVPDLFFWLKCGKMGLVELKTSTGKLSDKQKEFHNKIWMLGFDIITIYANSPMDGWKQVKWWVERLEGETADLKGVDLKSVDLI